MFNRDSGFRGTRCLFLVTGNLMLMQGDETSNTLGFRGHIGDCLEDFGLKMNLLGRQKDLPNCEMFAPMAEFCRAHINSVNRWVRDKNVPIGDNLYRVVSYLLLQGYTVIEVDRAPESFRCVIEMLGYGMMTVAQVAERLSLKKPQNVNRILWRKSGATEDKKQAIKTLWLEKREELGQLRAELRQRYAIQLPALDAKITALPRTRGPAKKRGRSVERVIPVVPTARIIPDDDLGMQIISVLEPMYLIFQDPRLVNPSAETLQSLRSAEPLIRALTSQLGSLLAKFIIRSLADHKPHSLPAVKAITYPLAPAEETAKLEEMDLDQSAETNPETKECAQNHGS